MSYSVDEFFSFGKIDGEYAVYDYLKIFDPTITELEYPSEYNGEPVTRIMDGGWEEAKYIKRIVIPPSVRVISEEAFYGFTALESAELSEGLEIIYDRAFRETRLKSIVFPKSLKELGDEAFWGCGLLESVMFNSSPSFGEYVFGGCFRLPPEIIVMSEVRSTDITRPVYINNYPEADLFPDFINLSGACFIPGVFELLAKNNCFRSCNLRNLFLQMIKYNEPELFPVAEQYGMLEDAAILDELISYSAERKNVELTAYLLELKRRKFGFGEGDNFEL